MLPRRLERKAIAVSSVDHTGRAILRGYEDSPKTGRSSRKLDFVDEGVEEIRRPDINGPSVQNER